MICKNCNSYNRDDADICENCGANLNVQRQNEYNAGRDCESKAFIGVVCFIFLGLIGLIIGLLIYPYQSYARKTFINGWVKSFIVVLVIGIAVVLFGGALIDCSQYGLLF